MGCAPLISTPDGAKSVSGRFELGVSIQCLAELVLRLLQAAFGHEQRAEIGVRVRVIRIDGNQALEVANRVTYPSLSRPHHAEVVERIAVVRVPRQRTLVLSHGLRFSSEPIENEAEIVARVRIVYTVEGAQENALGLAVAAQS